MARLKFRQFQNLISKIDQKELFDAVKPEVQNYADHRFSSLKKPEAYQKVLDLAYTACDGQGIPPTIRNPNELIQRMGAGRDGRGSYATERVHAERLYFYFLFDADLNDPGYSEQIDERLFKQSFHDEFERAMRRFGVPRPDHLAPLERARLGEITIALGFDVNLHPISVEKSVPSAFSSNGGADVYAALHWSSRLTPLYGRSEERDWLLEWATDFCTKHSKVVLISGPGGVGKTRLAADVVSELINVHGWEGGFLPASLPTDGAIFSGSNKGVALIIDYPEERMEITKGILKAVANNIPYSCPVRILLVSREDNARWGEHLNKDVTQWFDELRLESRPFLEMADALKLANEVAKEYPARVGHPKARMSGVDLWLDQDPIHRLPIFTLAASIHAVLSPNRAFKLSGRDVLKALAKIELERVRSYSERDLKSPKALEKLLALSLFTPSGLDKNSIFDLGNMGICEGKDGNHLLEAVQSTPFWNEYTGLDQGCLLRLEPDLPAAAFLAEALKLSDPAPSLPIWMAKPFEQSRSAFASTLPRLAMDLAQIDSSASANIETQALAMFDKNPAIFRDLDSKTFKNSEVFSAAFILGVCERLLAKEVDESEKISLLISLSNANMHLGKNDRALSNVEDALNLANNLALQQFEGSSKILAPVYHSLSIRLSEVGEYDWALKSSDSAINLYKFIFAKEPELLDIDFLTVLVSRAEILFNGGLTEDAFQLAKIVEAEYECLVQKHGQGFPQILVKLFDTLSVFCSRLGENFKAAQYALKAHETYRDLHSKNPSRHILGFIASADTLSCRLSAVGDPKAALEVAKFAETTCRTFIGARPAGFLPTYSGVLNNLSNRLVEAGQTAESISPAKKSVEIRCELAEIEPRTYLAEYARSLFNLADRLHKLGKSDEALSHSTSAVTEFKILKQKSDHLYRPNLALALSVHARVLLDLGKSDAATEIARESVMELSPLFLTDPAGHHKWMWAVINNYIWVCQKLDLEPDLETVEPVLSIMASLQSK